MKKPMSRQKEGLWTPMLSKRPSRDEERKGCLFAFTQKGPWTCFLKGLQWQTLFLESGWIAHWFPCYGCFRTQQQRLTSLLQTILKRTQSTHRRRNESSPAVLEWEEAIGFILSRATLNDCIRMDDPTFMSKFWPSSQKRIGKDFDTQVIWTIGLDPVKPNLLIR